MQEILAKFLKLKWYPPQDQVPKKEKESSQEPVPIKQTKTNEQTNIIQLIK